MGMKVIVTAIEFLKLLHVLEMLVFSAACVVLPLCILQYRNTENGYRNFKKRADN